MLRIDSILFLALVFFILGILLSSLLERLLPGHNLSYKRLIVWHVLSFSLYSFSLTCLIFTFTNLSLGLAMAFGSALYFFYLLFRTFGIGLSFYKGTNWNAYIFIIVAFCLELFVWRLLGTVWIASTATGSP